MTVGLGRTKWPASRAAAQGADLYGALGRHCNNRKHANSKLWFSRVEEFVPGNYPKFGRKPSEIFSSPLLGRKRAKNVGLRGRKIISLQGAPTDLGPTLEMACICICMGCAGAERVQKTSQIMWQYKGEKLWYEGRKRHGVSSLGWNGANTAEGKPSGLLSCSSMCCFLLSATVSRLEQN